MDKAGNIGIGYSFGDAANFAGQRFAARRAGDPLGQLTLGEAVLVDGEAAQTSTLRWQDYTQTAIDPGDDCTIWYVGDYLKKDAIELLVADWRVSNSWMRTMNARTVCPRPRLCCCSIGCTPAPPSSSSSTTRYGARRAEPRRSGEDARRLKARA